MRHYANVTQLIVPHSGPTCKADCLNWIVKGIREYQEQHGIRFAGVILYDAEDVVDTLSLKLFNCLMPEWDLVQIPIISLERPWWNLIGGHYMDEFAEAHCKEIHVREWFAGIVPGAGVGTGYSMRALDAATAGVDGDCFATDSLTEDYEFSFRVRESGLKQAFVRLPVERRLPRRSLFNRKPGLVVQRDFITTREFFPDLFWASVRQKTRWVIGISLQGWKNIRLEGRLEGTLSLVSRPQSIIYPTVNGAWLHRRARAD
jgi:adsorption protein B